MELKPSKFDVVSLGRYEDLFRRCFPSAHHLDVEYLEWLYGSNPSGTVIGFDAWDENRLAAHYVCIPVDACMGQAKARVLLSLNTATDPDYQGKGLFTRLAAATYELGAELGMHGVYGVANANSTPGFVRKLGFSLIGPLDAQIGVGSLPIAYERLKDHDISFRREWTPQSLAWRIARPARTYRVIQQHPGRLAVEMPTGKLGVRAWAEIRNSDDGKGAHSPASPALHLHLGLTPAAVRQRSIRWFDVPNRFRSSPLNLIYRSLTTDVRVPDYDNILFGQLDFDAF